MKVTDLTTQEKGIELIYVLKESLELYLIKGKENAEGIEEIILLDREQEYKDGFYDVMYFKFKERDNNCVFLGKWNNGKLPK